MSRGPNPGYLARKAAKRGDVDYLILALTDPEMRGYATIQLGKLGAKAAVPQLVRNLTLRDDADRSLTVYALSRIGDPSAIPALLEVAREDENLGVRTTAIDSLAQLGSREGVEMLAQLAIDPAPLLAGSVRFLNVPGSRTREKQLRQIRRWAAKRLRELRAIDAIPALTAGLGTVDLRHRIRLQRTIRALQRDR